MQYCAQFVFVQEQMKLEQALIDYRQSDCTVSLIRPDLAIRTVHTVQSDRTVQSTLSSHFSLPLSISFSRLNTLCTPLVWMRIAAVATLIRSNITN